MSKVLLEYTRRPHNNFEGHLRSSLKKLFNRAYIICDHDFVHTSEFHCMSFKLYVFDFMVVTIGGCKGATTGGSGGPDPPTFWMTPQLLTQRFCRDVHRQASRVTSVLIQKKKERRNSTCYYCRYYPLFNARQHTDARYWYSNSVRPSVRLSVRPSVTSRYWMKTA